MKSSNKVVLITGGNGLLGQKLTDIYRALTGVTLIVTSQGDNRHPDLGNAIYESLDITDRGAVAVMVKKYQPDCVINTAAMTNVDACETAREACWAINVDAVENLAKLCSENNAHLIHISTDFIFPGTKAMYSEDDKPEPLSYYGKSKWEGERRIMEHAGSWAILRTVIVFGIANKLSRGNIVQWAYDTLQKGHPANVVDDQFRTPTLAEDLAMGCRLVEAQSATGVFNICGKDFMSILELVKRVAAFFKLDTSKVSVVSTESLNQPAKRPPITGLDISKARNILGYEPHSFEEGLEIFRQQLPVQ
jgi:dTDP-4-dehydrorhamnose reductase